MVRSTIGERTRLSIDIALAALDPDPSRQRQQEAVGRGLGMMGAEIDAAREGRSFDAQISMAITLALAARLGPDEGRQERRAQASRLGFSEDACAAIEAYATAQPREAEDKDRRHA